MRDDEIAACSRGCTSRARRSLAFIVSAACAGLGGGLLAVVTPLAAPGAFPLALSVALLTGAILGGLGMPRWSRTRSPPFRVAEFDMMHAGGISYEGDVLDLAIAQKLVVRSEPGSATASYN